jgi:hypothetical protein
MTKNVLLAGCTYAGPPIPDTNFDILGLCRPSIDNSRAAYALYEYDVIVINPQSYSHFLFGYATAHSLSNNELWDLKKEKNDYDLDNAFDSHDRSEELKAAVAAGTRVVWLLAKPKNTQFYGMRSVYAGYANLTAKKAVESGTIHEKKSRRLQLTADVGEFQPYFEHLQAAGWNLCLADHNDQIQPFALTPEGYTLGGKVFVNGSHAWLLTPPPSQEAMDLLIQGALGLPPSAVPRDTYHGIFLSHNSEDKPFVRELKARLEAHGAKEVWLDEAEILVGDSLTKKIAEGLTKTKYIAAVLSPRSVKSSWVERELEVAINREISTGEVVVLPLLYEKCELPSFLIGKMYADFTSPAGYDDGVAKLLRRLKKA